jgi:hypothetical protein
MRTFPIITLTLLLAAAPLHAAAISDTYVIPVAGHVSGANGETWTTDVVLHNTGDASLLVELTGVDSSGQFVDVTPATATLPAHGTVALRDIRFASGGTGALLLLGDAPFAISSRIYTDGARGSVGQSVPAMNTFADASTPDAFITGLMANDHYRTNIGFFAASDGGPMTVEITLFDAAGVRLGSKTFPVAAGAFSHMQISSRQIASASFDAASARVRVLSGDGLVTGYASVVDNFSSDASFIPADIDTSAAPTLLRQRVMLRSPRGAARW